MDADNYNPYTGIFFDATDKDRIADSLILICHQVMQTHPATHAKHSLAEKVLLTMSHLPQYKVCVLFASQLF